MKFLVDNQLPAELARFLARNGIDCQHVLDVGLAEAKDMRIWEYAGAYDRIIISKDEDFLYLASLPEAKARFVWIRFGNCGTKLLLHKIEQLWGKVEEGFNNGAGVIELR